jgi:hypothetical protein
MRLIANNVFEKEQFVDLSAENDTAHGISSSTGISFNDSDSGSGGGSIDGGDVDDDDLDYILLDDRVRFPPNSTVSDPFRVQIVDDDEVENYEKFYLSFSIPESASSCGAVAGRNTKMEFLIRDDDGIRVGFLPDVRAVVGVEGRTVSLKVYRDGCSWRFIRVNVAIRNGTASADDYTLLTRFLTFSSFRCFIVRDVRILLKNDRIPERIESFDVVLTGVNHKSVGFDIQKVPVFILPSALEPVTPPTVTPTTRRPTRPWSPRWTPTTRKPTPTRRGTRPPFTRPTWRPNNRG